MDEKFQDTTGIKTIDFRHVCHYHAIKVFFCKYFLSYTVTRDIASRFGRPYPNSLPSVINANPYQIITLILWKAKR